MRPTMKNSQTPRLVALMVGLMIVSLAAPALAGGATVDRIDGPFETVVPVADADNPEGVELMFAECSFTQWRQLPDGRARETQQCELTEPFFVFPGEVPDTAYNNFADPCKVASDYWLQTDGSLVLGDWAHITVTPSGQVQVTITFPAEPLTVEECGPA